LVKNNNTSLLGRSYIPTPSHNKTWLMKIKKKKKIKSIYYDGKTFLATLHKSLEKKPTLNN